MFQTICIAGVSLIALSTPSAAGSLASVNTSGGHQECTACVAISSFNGIFKYNSAPPDWWLGDPSEWQLEGNLRQYAMARVDGAVLRTQIESRFSPTRVIGDPIYLPNTGANAAASISDSLLIDTPTSHGQRGRFTITLQADWTFPEYSGYYSIGARSGVKVTDSTGIDAEAYLYTGGYYTDWPELGSYTYYREGDIGTSSDFAPQLKISIPITYGTPLNLQFFLDGFIGGNYAGNYSGIIQAANSAKWGGISNLVDSTGAPVLDYTISSESGMDWERSYISVVPEPSAMYLLLPGILLLCARAPSKLNRRIA